MWALDVPAVNIDRWGGRGGGATQPTSKSSNLRGLSKGVHEDTTLPSGRRRLTELSSHKELQPFGTWVDRLHYCALPVEHGKPQGSSSSENECVLHWVQVVLGGWRGSASLDSRVFRLLKVGFTKYAG